MQHEQYRYDLTKQHLEAQRCLAAERRLAQKTCHISPPSTEPNGLWTRNDLYAAYSGFYL